MRFPPVPAWSIGNGCALFTAKFSRLRDAFQRDLSAGRQHPAKGSEVGFQDYSVASFTIVY
ncbi:hypothetical protein, partial [Staphylococcus aureus]